MCAVKLNGVGLCFAHLYIIYASIANGGILSISAYTNDIHAGGLNRNLTGEILIIGCAQLSIRNYRNRHGIFVCLIAEHYANICWVV